MKAGRRDENKGRVLDQAKACRQYVWSARWESLEQKAMKAWEQAAVGRRAGQKIKKVRKSDVGGGKEGRSEDPKEREDQRGAVGRKIGEKTRKTRKFIRSDGVSEERSRSDDQKGQKVRRRRWEEGRSKDQKDQKRQKVRHVRCKGSKAGQKI